MSTNLRRNYSSILKGLKEKIRQARNQAALAANSQLLILYWEIGQSILEQQGEEGWGTQVIGRLSKDLRAEFPDMKGLSERNLVYMQSFAVAYPVITQQPVAKIKAPKKVQKSKSSITQQPVAEMLFNGTKQHPVTQLPWGHNCVLLDKVKTLEARLFYAAKTLENGWSRNILILQIKNDLYNKTVSIP